MKTKLTFCSTALLGFCAAYLPSASAVEVGVDLELGRSRGPVVVQPPPREHMRWVPERIEHRTEQVVVAQGRVERREERVVVEPARRIHKDERVLVAPERVERVPEQFMVRPAKLEKQWVPPVIEEVDVGPVRVKKTVREGFFREVQVPAVYETRHKEVIVPARYEMVSREVELPPRYEVKIVEVPVGPRYETVTRDVVIPGHWEEITVIPPPVVVEKKHDSFNLDLEFGKKR